MDEPTRESTAQASVQTETRVKKKSVLREYAEAILIAIILALLIRTFVVQAFKIPSGSMIPTLLVGDHILVNKFIFYFRDPHRGDVIVFKYPWDESRDFIKRIIAVGGEEVAMKDRTVFINGRPLEEAYAIYSDVRPPGGRTYEYGPVVVPAGSYFVMGDNRDNSQDSRFWGFLKREKIRGKSFLIYWSWDSEKGRLRWWRLGRLIP
jgi:signal peptidase I